MLSNELSKLNFSGSVSRDIPIGNQTGFKTGGNADFFVEPNDIGSLKNFVSLMNIKKEKFDVIGQGTNLLIKSSGVKYALSLKKGFNVFSVEKESSADIYLRVQSGTSLQKICWHCAKKGYQGLNPLIGIPGSVGGAVYMNAGTNLGSISQVLEQITIMDQTGEVSVMEKNDFSGEYRSLKLKNGLTDFIVVNALLKLEKSDEEIVYSQAKQMILQRKKNQPVKANSCGCFFKNPGNNIFAGKLIEKAGLKGKSVGGAQISDIHANFITNINNASYEDIINLKDLVQKEVKKKFNILLEPEVKIVGR